MVSFNDQLARMKKSVSTASDVVHRVMGKTVDPHLRLYETLQPHEFDAIRKVYGDEATMNYIKEMESKRILGGNDG